LALQRLAVLGCGNGGQTCAADLALAGFDIALYELPEFRHNLTPIIQKGGIKISGAARNGFAKLALVTTDIKDAIEGAELIQIVCPAFAHKAFCELCAPYLEDSQAVVFYGKGGGSLELVQALKRSGNTKKILFGETSTLPYACRVVAPAEVHVYESSKHLLMTSAFPSSMTSDFVKIIKEVYPAATACANVLETMLHDYNAVIHPAVVLLNAGRIEYSGGKFFFYREGLTPSTGKLVECVDRERLEILRALGLRGISLIESTGNPKFHSVYEAMRREDLLPISGPHDLRDRYLTEDIPFGLVTYSSIANLVAVQTGVMDSLITIASRLHDVNYRETGRTIAKLGLSGFDKGRLLEYVSTGVA
jgi:opine dehydrogenase